MVTIRKMEWVLGSVNNYDTWYTWAIALYHTIYRTWGTEKKRAHKGEKQA
jgi:hypothetical protein